MQKYRRHFIVGMVFALCLANLSGTVQAQSVDLTHITGLWGSDSLQTDWPVTFSLAFNNSSPESITGYCAGFRIWHTGGTRSPIVMDTAFYVSQALHCAGMDGGQFYRYLGNDGLDADTAAFSGYRIFGPGLPPGTVCDMIRLTVSLGSDADGEIICLDSCWYPPSCDWSWTDPGGLVVPQWEGPFCFTVHDCCAGMRGNINGDAVDKINIVDLTFLVAYLFDGGPEPPCWTEADINADGSINVTDLTRFVDWFMAGGTSPPPEPCP